MDTLDKFKIWHTCKKEGRIEEYKSYKKCLELLESDINRYRNYLDKATQKFANIQQNFSEDSKEYRDAKDEVYRWQETLDRCILELKFVRPNSQQDINYRNNQCENFVNNLQSVVSPNLNLRFHGTPIYYAEQIIKSGTISSTADRYDGYIKSTDMKGEISASSVKTLGRTINFFSDITAYRSSLPCGCIFALLPKDEADATYGKDLLHSVDFRQNPQQLYGIFTTPENKEQVKEWMSESGFNPDTVYTFEEFLQKVNEKSNDIEEQDKGEADEKATTYLFDEKDAEGIAFKRRTGRLQKLKEMIKNAIQNKLKTNDLEK